MRAHPEWPTAAGCLAPASPRLCSQRGSPGWQCPLEPRMPQLPNHVLHMATSSPRSRTPGRVGRTAVLTSITQSLRNAGGPEASVSLAQSISSLHHPPPKTRPHRAGCCSRHARRALSSQGWVTSSPWPHRGVKRVSCPVSCG